MIRVFILLLLSFTTYSFSLDCQVKSLYTIYIQLVQRFALSFAWGRVRFLGSWTLSISCVVCRRFFFFFFSRSSKLNTYMLYLYPQYISQAAHGMLYLTPCLFPFVCDRVRLVEKWTRSNGIAFAVFFLFYRFISFYLSLCVAFSRSVAVSAKCIAWNLLGIKASSCPRGIPLDLTRQGDETRVESLRIVTDRFLRFFFVVLSCVCVYILADLAKRVWSFFHSSDPIEDTNIICWGFEKSKSPQGIKKKNHHRYREI